MSRPFVIIPTNRDPAFFEGFLRAWKEEFKGCHIIIVEDRPKKILEKVVVGVCQNTFTYDIYDWGDIDKDLKEKSWIIPRKSDCIRSYGFYKAWQNKALFIATLDDDTKPRAAGHINKFGDLLLNWKDWPEKHWYCTLRDLVPRGTIVEQERASIVHGGWVCVPDLSAAEQLKQPSLGVTEYDHNQGVIPIGAHYSMCGMNIAFRTEMTPQMYFGLQGHVKEGKELKKLPIDRCGDIWAGLYSKKDCDECDRLVVTGEPFVIHDRASNVWANYEKEENAERYTEAFIDKMVLEKGDSFFLDWDEDAVDYFDKLVEAYAVWEKLFDE